MVNLLTSCLCFPGAIDPDIVAAIVEPVGVIVTSKLVAQVLFVFESTVAPQEDD